jgi:hypothetical protein
VTSSNYIFIQTRVSPGYSCNVWVQFVNLTKGIGHKFYQLIRSSPINTINLHSIMIITYSFKLGYHLVTHAMFGFKQVLCLYFVNCCVGFCPIIILLYCLSFSDLRPLGTEAPLTINQGTHFRFLKSVYSKRKKVSIEWAISCSLVYDDFIY